MKPIVYFATLLLANATYAQISIKNTEPFDSKGIRKNVQSLNCSEVVNNGELTAGVPASGVTTVIPYMASSKASVTYNKNGGPDDVLNDIDITGYYHVLGNWGLRNTVNEPFGNIAETVIYNSPTISDADNAKIESYLAIKYGITLDQTTAQSYINSSGTEIYDADGAFDDFDKDIIGIGQDDNGSLDQRISKSVNAGSILILSNNADFTSANNTAGRTSLGDGNFLVTGHNGGAVEFTEALANSEEANKRMPRIWAFDETETVGNVHIAIKTSDVTFPDNSDNKLYAILSTDQRFGGLDPAIEMRKDGDYWSAEVDPADGQFMSFAVNEISNEFAPGGVSNNIIAWLKSESGTNTTTDGEDVTQWNNSVSNPVYNLEYISSMIPYNEEVKSSPPSYESDGDNLLNFHPTVLFRDIDGEERQRLYIPEVKVSDPNTNLLAQTIRGSTVYFIGMPNGNYKEFWGGVKLSSHAETTFSTVPFVIQDNNTISFWTNTGNIVTPYVSNLTWGNNEIAFAKMTVPDADNGNITYNKNGGVNHVVNDVNINGYYQAFGNYGLFNHVKDAFGNIAETVIYNSPTISDADNAKIESYLAIKYGITLDQTTPQSYINSLEAEIYDADGVYDAFDKNIIGIGQDDNGSLDQRISKSVNAGSILILSNDTDFTSANNTAGRTSLGDGNFLVTGHNGGAVEFTEALANSEEANKRMPRIWAFDETGTVGNVHIAMKTSDVTLPDNTANKLYAILSTDQTFEGSDSVIEMTNYGSYWSAEVDPADGQFMSFAIREDPSIQIVALATDYNLYYYKYNEGYMANGVWEKIPGTGIVATGNIPEGVTQFQDFDMIDKNNIVATDSLNLGHNTYRWNGERWTALPSTVDRQTESISIAHDGAVFASQDNMIYYLDGNQWTRVSIPEYKEIHIHNIDAFSKDEVYASNFHGRSILWKENQVYYLQKWTMSGQHIYIYDLSIGKDKSIFACGYNPRHPDKKGVYLVNWDDDGLWAGELYVRGRYNIKNLEALRYDKFIFVDIDGNIHFWDWNLASFLLKQTPLSKIDSDGNSLSFIKASIGERATRENVTRERLKSYQYSRMIDFESANDFKNYNGEIPMDKMVLYPNPANNKLHIRVNKAIRRASVEIYSMNGNLVYKKSNLSLSNGYRSISNIEQLLSSGNYVLKIRHKKGIISKIIIKK